MSHFAAAIKNNMEEETIEYMNPVRKMYNEAIANTDFIAAFEKAEGCKFREPSYFDKQGVADVAAVYFGWMLARGTYKRQRYT